MRITRIDIEGREGRYATVARRHGSKTIEVTVLTPQEPNGKAHRVRASGNEGELQAAARNLHMVLEGHAGTHGDVQAYYDVLVRFAD